MATPGFFTIALRGKPAGEWDIGHWDLGLYVD
jgi:hypothetical protein